MPGLKKTNLRHKVLLTITNSNKGESFLIFLEVNLLILLELMQKVYGLKSNVCLSFTFVRSFMMSRSTSHRPTSNSRGSSSSGHRALSVTEALQTIRLTETVGEYHVSRQRPSIREDESSPYEPSPFVLPTLDPSVLDPYPTTTASSYSRPTGLTASPLSTSSTMRYVDRIHFVEIYVLTLRFSKQTAIQRTPSRLLATLTIKAFVPDPLHIMVSLQFSIARLLTPLQIAVRSTK